MPEPAPVWLLDKNVVRRAIEGIGASLVAVPLTTEQSLAIRLLIRGKQTRTPIMITPETANILTRRRAVLGVRLFLNEVKVVRRGRYFKRWARRLREHGFTREDAKVLSYATFGLDPNDNMLGLTFVVTFDRALLANFEAHREVLIQRLRTMTAQLRDPYRGASMPVVTTPKHVL